MQKFGLQITTLRRLVRISETCFNRKVSSMAPILQIALFTESWLTFLGTLTKKLKLI